MASKVQICNIALSRIGISRQISAIDEDSAEASICALHYGDTLKAMLRDHPWPFATKRKALGLVDGSDTDPTNRDFTYAYEYPSDCLYFRRIITSRGREEHSPEPFEVGRGESGRLIFTDVEEAVGEYTVDITDPAELDPLFVVAFGWALAAEIAIPLSVKEQMRQRAIEMANATLNVAAASAFNESQHHEQPESEFIRARS